MASKNNRNRQQNDTRMVVGVVNSSRTNKVDGSGKTHNKSTLKVGVVQSSKTGGCSSQTENSMFVKSTTFSTTGQPQHKPRQKQSQKNSIQPRPRQRANNFKSNNDQSQQQIVLNISLSQHQSIRQPQPPKQNNNNNAPKKSKEAFNQSGSGHSVKTASQNLNTDGSYGRRICGKRYESKNQSQNNKVRGSGRSAVQTTLLGSFFQRSTPEALTYMFGKLWK